MTSSLSPLDYGVILAYLAGTLALGLWIGSRVKSGTDYFLAGRQLPWWAIGMSLVATDISGTDIIGAGGAAYQHGLAVANFEWIGCVPAMIVAAFLFVPFFYRTGVYTIPEFMERRYNVGVRSVLATCWLVFMACNLGVMLLSAAKMGTAMVDVNAFARMFGGQDFSALYQFDVLGWRPVASDQALLVWASAILVGVYTVSGGLAADVWTDVVQCVVMIGGCLAVMVIGLADIGGIDALRAKLPTEAHGSLIVPADAASPFPWPAIYFGLALVLSPAYWIGNQAIIQRSLGARSEFAAKASYVWGAVLKTCIPLITVVPGLIAAVKFQDLENVDYAVPRLVVELLPAGARGLFVAAFLAALMSSVDSYLNSAATIVSHDFYKRFADRAASDRRLLFVGRGTTLLLNVWAIGFALWLTGVKSAGVYAVFQTLMAFFQGPALAILLGGLFWRRATGKAALVSLLCGIACSASLFALSQGAVIERLGWKPLFRVETPFLYFSVWAFAVTLVLLVILSLATRPEGTEKTQHVLLGFTRRSA